MPIYEYECTACGTFFEELVLGTEKRVRCPECRSKSLKKIISSTSAPDSRKTFAGRAGDQTVTTCGASRFS